MDVSKLIVIWPNNVDSTKTIKKGRRIPKASGCERAREGLGDTGGCGVSCYFCSLDRSLDHSLEGGPLFFGRLRVVCLCSAANRRPMALVGRGVDGWMVVQARAFPNTPASLPVLSFCCGP